MATNRTLILTAVIALLGHTVSAQSKPEPNAAPKNLPNILLIAIDDLRPELSSYKADGIKTPNIDRLAQKGLQFNAAYCQYPVCNPSRSSFLTGKRPDELGILSNRIPVREKWPDLVTLPQHFRDHGYFTAGLGKLFHAGLDSQGKHTLFQDELSFEHFFKAKGSEPKIGRQGEGRRLGDGSIKWAQWRAAEGGDLAQADGMLAAEAIRLLEEDRNRPFFISVGFHKPHDPFVAPKEYFELYPEDQIQLDEDPKDRTAMLRYALPDSYGRFRSFEGRDRREFKRAYHACTSFVDAQVGKLLDTLDRQELWDDTIVIMLGDHGYHLGEHGWWNKVTVFDIGAKVPLVMWVPNRGAMGGETGAVVELVDLFPTLVSLAGIDPPHELSGSDLGLVLDDSNADWNQPAYTQVTRGPVGMGYSVRLGDWRFTQWGKNAEGGVELYHVLKDREGYYNRADEPRHAERMGRMFRVLKAGFSEIQGGPR